MYTITSLHTAAALLNGTRITRYTHRHSESTRAQRPADTSLEPEIHVGCSEGQETLLHICSMSFISLGQSAERMRGES